MNESATDDNTVFGKAAGTAMGIGAGALGVGAGAYMLYEAGKGTINGIKDGVDSIRKAKNVSQSKPVGNKTTIGDLAAKTAKSNGHTAPTKTQRGRSSKKGGNFKDKAGAVLSLVSEGVKIAAEKSKEESKKSTKQSGPNMGEPILKPQPRKSVSAKVKNPYDMSTKHKSSYGL